MGGLCMFVSNIKEFSTDLNNSFFPMKVWTKGVTWTSEAVLQDLPLDFDENCHNFQMFVYNYLEMFKTILLKYFIDFLEINNFELN